ncbi:phosphatidylethanolamine N-methyltransferase, partial [Dimargaris xerosporica]
MATNQLRQRGAKRPPNRSDSDTEAPPPKQAHTAPAELNASVEPCLVYGRIPTKDNQLFQVPQTHDFITSLFSPWRGKTTFDYCTLAVILSQAALYLVLPLHVKRPLFIVLFLFWRLMYNGGLGYLLKLQSDRQQLVKWVRQWGWLDPKAHQPYYATLKRELAAKMSKDYDFDAMPEEFNTWLLFRQLVDLILINDF